MKFSSLNKDSVIAFESSVLPTPVVPRNMNVPIGLLESEVKLDGKLNGIAVRVPTSNVSMIDLTFSSKRQTTPEEINDVVRHACGTGKLKNVLSYTDEKLVSTDFFHNPHSSIFHTDQTFVTGSKLVRILSWYDNEWGFSNRMADTAVEISKHL